MADTPTPPTPQQTLDALEATFAHGATIVGQITPAQLSAPTPCSEWDVRALLEHTTAVIGGMGAAAGGRPPAGAFDPTNDPAGQFRALAAETMSAWRAPGVLESTLNAGAGPMPGAVYAGINLLDTATHVWDLAKATGQPTELPAEVAETALGCARMIIAEPIRPGRFAPAVDAAANASATDRLAAFLGRQP